MIILAPIAASLIQLAISRSREFEADATGAKETGNPMPWRGRSRSLMRTRAHPDAGLAHTAHLFIVAPLLGSGRHRQSILDASSN